MDLHEQLSLNKPSVERLRQAEAVDEAIVLVSRANQDPGLCKRLLDGHKRVLKAYGIKNLSSFRTDWFRRDDVMVIAVLSGDGERVLAGARLQPGLVANDFPLHQAVGHMDPEVGNFLERIIPEGAYEMNALWNSIELAGMGMGSEFLIQVAMAAMPLIEAKHLVALTSRSRDVGGRSTAGSCAASWATTGTLCTPRTRCGPPWSTTSIRTTKRMSRLRCLTS